MAYPPPSPRQRNKLHSSSIVRLVFVASLGASAILFLWPHRIELRTHTTIKVKQQQQQQQEAIEPSGRPVWWSQKHPGQSKAENSDDDDLSCLIHKTITVPEPLKKGSDPSKHILEHQVATNCGRLRRNWLHNPPLSDYAKEVESHQSDCSLPLARHYFDNTFGMGSHLFLWGQAVCNSIQNGHRMVSVAPDWLWLDHEHCDMEHQSKISPLLCYFPASEDRCYDAQGQLPTKLAPDATDRNETLRVPVQVPPHIPNVTDPRVRKDWCSLVRESDDSRIKVRAASTEYLFQRVSPLVIREAKRQVGVLFPNGIVPDDLVTVHVRWGDKFWEMDLPPIEEYIDAVRTILAKRQASNPPTHSVTTPKVNIYLATEDPRAYREFMDAKPDSWTVYADLTLREIDAFRPPKGNRASWAARNTRGRSGLVALASLLVAVEANDFVLTTKSNWSSLMDHLRTNVIDPRCGNCTTLVDLRPGMW